MSRTVRRVVVLILGVAGTLGWTSPAGAAGEPTVPDPAVRATRIAGDVPSEAYDVNAAGTIVGNVDVGAGDDLHREAFRWSHGRLRSLDPPNPGSFSSASNINRRGDVLVQTPNGARLRSGGRWLEFPGMAGVALNDAGEVVLSEPLDQDLTNPNRALLWTHGRLIELLPPGTPEHWTVYGIGLNNAGQVLVRVYGETFPADYLGYVWTRGRFVQLQPMRPGDPLDPRFLDERGRVIGRDIPSDGQASSVAVWDRNGRATRLPAPEGSIGSFPDNINDRGQVVGSTAFADGSSRITVWTGGQPMLLPGATPGYVLSRSAVINNLGQVAWTETRDGTSTDIGVAWWLGRTVPLGPGIVTAMGDGGVIVGYDWPGHNATYAMRWSIDWRAVFHRR